MQILQEKNLTQVHGVAFQALVSTDGPIFIRNKNGFLTVDGGGIIFEKPSMTIIRLCFPEAAFSSGIEATDENLDMLIACIEKFDSQMVSAK